MTTNELLQEITGTVRTNGSGSITGAALQKVLTDMAGAPQAVQLGGYQNDSSMDSAVKAEALRVPSGSTGGVYVNKIIYASSSGSGNQKNYTYFTLTSGGAVRLVRAYGSVKWMVNVYTDGEWGGWANYEPGTAVMDVGQLANIEAFVERLRQYDVLHSGAVVVVTSIPGGDYMTRQFCFQAVNPGQGTARQFLFGNQQTGGEFDGVFVRDLVGINAPDGATAYEWKRTMAQKFWLNGNKLEVGDYSSSGSGTGNVATVDLSSIAGGGGGSVVTATTDGIVTSKMYLRMLKSGVTDFNTVYDTDALGEKIIDAGWLDLDAPGLFAFKYIDDNPWVINGVAIIVPGSTGERRSALILETTETSADDADARYYLDFTTIKFKKDAGTWKVDTYGDLLDYLSEFGEFFNNVETSSAQTSYSLTFKSPGLADKKIQIGAASPSGAGVMTAADKKKLDGLTGDGLEDLGAFNTWALLRTSIVGSLPAFPALAKVANMQVLLLCDDSVSGGAGTRKVFAYDSAGVLYTLGCKLSGGRTTWDADWTVTDLTTGGAQSAGMSIVNAAEYNTGSVSDVTYVEEATAGDISAASSAAVVWIKRFSYSGQPGGDLTGQGGRFYLRLSKDGNMTYYGAWPQVSAAVPGDEYYNQAATTGKAARVGMLFNFVQDGQVRFRSNESDVDSLAALGTVSTLEG